VVFPRVLARNTCAPPSVPPPLRATAPHSTVCPALRATGIKTTVVCGVGGGTTALADTDEEPCLQAELSRLTFALSTAGG